MSILLTALVFGALFAPSSAMADGPVVCPAGKVFCIVTATSRATPGATSGPARPQPDVGASSPCLVAGKPVPCWDPQFGSFNRADSCYYKLANPQPAASDPAWQGHYPSGAIYEATCPAPSLGQVIGWVWLAAPPGGAGGVSPAQVAQEAVTRLGLRGAAIGMAPPAGTVGLVHEPVWFWTARTATTWGPVSATATVAGVSVTATARAAQIIWQTGDRATVTCVGPGTPYQVSFGSVASPTCGHVYEQSSTGQPSGAFTVTATTTWQITWIGGGQTGALTTTRTATARVRIGELQVVT